jgi:secondary thiamine-phosphate synthase enzyme
MEQCFSCQSIVTGCFSSTNITREIEIHVAESGTVNGFCHLSCLHTSAPTLVQENASPDVRRALMKFLARVAPMQSGLYEHEIEEMDDMLAHLRTGITQTHITMSIRNGRLVLGK